MNMRAQFGLEARRADVRGLTRFGIDPHVHPGSRRTHVTSLDTELALLDHRVTVSVPHQRVHRLESSKVV